MNAEKKEDSLKWSLVVGLIVILAGITGFMVVNKHEIFPERYQKASHVPSHSNSESDTVKVKTEQTHH